MVQLAAAVFAAVAGAGPPARYDVVVYDGTSGGVTAAVAAARHGARTALLCASWPACWTEGGRILGGMSSGGLGQTDNGGHPEIIGGLALEFYTRNRRHYGNITDSDNDNSCRRPAANCNATYNLEPHVAQGIFAQFVAEAGVDVLWEAQVASVSKQGAELTALTLTDGRVVQGAVFIDAGYEGDLMARAGVSYVLGRESAAQYGESLAGRRSGNPQGNEFSVAVDPYGPDGRPLPLLAAAGSGKPGDGDKLVQSYNFRLCVTKDPALRFPFPKPKGYNSSTWELLRRYLTKCASAKCQLGFPSCTTNPLPGVKYDMNNCGGLSSDYIGGSWEYPEASYERRREIWEEHRAYTEGLLWTMANDPGVPQHMRDEMAQWGLCGDEFHATEHFSPALYVRSARRLKGDKVFTENTPKSPLSPTDVPIGLGGYNFDSHNAQRFVCPNRTACYGQGPKDAGPSTPFAWDEGDVQVGPGVYQIPMWVMLPRAAEASNLLVVAAPSASHIGMSTLRMEPQFMIIGHSAGATAALAANTTAGMVHDVNTSVLRGLLLADKQLLSR
eukprot:TRINITY_DN17089_c0_g1_i1.p1 TRINITY_DN17089_c0_g1~~TRINITY_DN17089_c0_g1_i1.p1  ORF type:complete len:582 (+),score=139.11 TRINITY_DN17089_c0_g1_i1:77-1747(+)